MRDRMNELYLLLAALGAGGIFSFWFSGLPDRLPTDEERRRAQNCFDHGLCYRCDGPLSPSACNRVRFQICDACAG